MSGTIYGKALKSGEERYINSRLPDTEKLTHDILYEYYCLKNPDLYFSRLCKDSIWIGGSGQIILGGQSIREHLAVTKERPEFLLYDEDYHRCDTQETSVVCGTISLKRKNSTWLQTRFIQNLTFHYQLVQGELKLLSQHVSYDWYPETPKQHVFSGNQDIQVFPYIHYLASYRFKRHERLTFEASGIRHYIDPNLILYLEFYDKKVVIQCVDKTVHIRSTLKKMEEILPEEFFRIHHSYIVNSHYVTWIKRYEVGLAGGLTVPVSRERFMAIRETLTQYITQQQISDMDIKNDQLILVPASEYIPV